MKKTVTGFLFVLVLTFISNDVLGQKNSPYNHNETSKISQSQLSNIAPYLNATGNQTYCPGGSTKIVTDMTIVDPDDIGIDAIYVQISSGYSFGEDLLTLIGTHPNIISAWNATTGTLTLTGITGQPTYIELIAAIKDIEFSSSVTNPSGIRNFSISVGQANYLPSNGHYYLFVPNIGITWTAAQVAAQASTYYGLQGYLATITSAEEGQIAGEQTIGAGWIGGSDQETEGIWKWMTGPETGTVFWNGNFTGFTTNFAFWNTGEPNNNIVDEDYAHVTAPGIGISGSWNDLSNTGSTSGDYQPKGYIVEYGGMPGDPILHISTSTSMSIPTISSTPSAPRCGAGTLNLQASSTNGIVNWYEFPTGGLPLGSGDNFTTPIISDTTIFYAAAHYGGCLDISRIPVTAFVTPKPMLSVTSPYYMCDESYKVIDVETSLGVMFWYDNPTNLNPIFLGTHFVVPNIHENTIFYAEANYNNCLSERVPVQVNVYSLPDVNDETIELCERETTLLNAGNPGMTYLWSTGETTQTIISNGLTNYSVVITTAAPESCSKTKNFIIIYHSQPIIDTIEIQDLMATIIMAQSGDFEYSLDNLFFQTSNIFTVFEGGNYIGYVREKNGCGGDQKPFIVISIPKFFTPNGDNINDTWSIKGMFSYSTTAEVAIFDRFGKLITILNTANPYWSGTMNGKQLPANDYWFVAKINNSFPETRGHFSLKR